MSNADDVWKDNIWDPVSDAWNDLVEDVGDFLEDVRDEIQEGIMDLLGVDDAIDDALAQIEGTLVNKRSNIAPIPVLYGERLMGGTIVHMSTTGSDNKYLHLVFAIAEECSAVTQVLIDDIPWNDSKWGGTIFYEIGLGDHTTQPFPDLESKDSNWTSSHLLKGTCCAHVRITWNQEIHSGIPNVKFLVEGKRLYDPRNTLTLYSTNPALAANLS